MLKEEFKHLFDTYFEDVRRYVLYRCGDGDLATDIAQDVFMRIWEKQMEVRPETAKNLLLKIAGDLYISHYRREKRAFDFFSTWQPADPGRSPEENLEYQQLEKAVGEAIRSMPEKQRVVFLMNRIDELKYREIATQLGLSVKAVEKRMSLALLHLKSFLKDKGTRIILFLFGNRFLTLSSARP